MQTLHEAAFEVVRQLFEIGANEGKLPSIVGLHSVQDIGDGQVSVWLLLDDENANEGMGIVNLHVDERAVRGVDHDDLLRALTGWRPSPTLVTQNNIQQWVASARL